MNALNRPCAQVRFEDVQVGQDLVALRKGPLTNAHLMRWSSTMENWHRIHYDQRYALERENLPGLLINGSFKQQFIVQLLKDWAGREGWVWKTKFQFRAMDVVGATLEVWARVTAKHQLPSYGLVELDLGIRNLDENGRESTPGSALVALPYAGGNRVPYPFVPPAQDPWKGVAK